jgi:hypothetical protein
MSFMHQSMEQISSAPRMSSAGGGLFMLTITGNTTITAPRGA